MNTSVGLNGGNRNDTTKMINPLLVDNFLFIHGETPQNAKRLKRNFVKKQMMTCISSKSVKQGQFENEAISLIFNHLVTTKKKNVRQLPECIGVFCDTNVILNDITRLPPPPVEWDVLCCESDVTKYNYNSAHNNIYWCATSIKDTRHFVINSRSIDKVLQIIKKSKNWTSFIKSLQTDLLVYTITQYYLSERYAKALPLKLSEDVLRRKTATVEEKRRVVEEYGMVCSEKLTRLSKEYINIKHSSDKYDTILSKMSKEESYKLLPKVSLVCLLTSPQNFFHTLHSFLKIDYPRDKLQLIIVDDIDSEKKLKQFLPEDSRIKIINITKRSSDQAKPVHLPLGYKLNTGIKYADHDIIFNFFDTNHYFISKFRMLIKAFLVSSCDILVGGETSGMTSENESVVDDIPSVANMLYNKNFWKVDAFDESYNESNIVLYNFIKNRSGCIRYAPFLYFSFEHANNNWYRKLKRKLQFNLQDIIDPLTKDSFELLKTVQL